MSVIFEGSYTLPGTDQPLTHARIAHAGNWISGGTITASTTATDYFEAGPDNSLTYEKWQPTAVAATWENDLGSALELDYCCIAGHNMGTVGTTLSVEYDSTGGGSWVSVLSQAITSDMPIFAIFEPRTFQKWRLNLTVAIPTISVIRFGSAMQMERPFYGGHAPLHMARQTLLRSNMSESGEFLGRTKQRTFGATSMAWSNLTAAWVRANWRPFQLATETEPFFIAWRPTTFSEVGYCQLDAVPVPENMGVRDLMSVEMGVRSLGYD